MITKESNISPPSYRKRLTVELLALDLDKCKRCTETDANIRLALNAVAGVLQEAGVEVECRKVVVKTAEQAEQLRFESSPTIRINGRDIALDFRESPCGDCGDLCGCNGGVNCRVWVWQGREHLAAPKAMIIDAILKAYAGSAQPAPASSQPFRLPENLSRFFAAAAGCCDTTLCCEPSAKAACCGAEPQSASCGWR